MSQVTSQVIHQPVQSDGACGLPKLKPTDLSRENEREVLEREEQEQKLRLKMQQQEEELRFWQ